MFACHFPNLVTYETINGIGWIRCMHPTLHLFYLIRNLDTAEVKYFRAYAKRKVKSGTSSALALFDLIFANEFYDDEAFEKAVGVGNFPALKVYLYDMIAEAMLEREMKRKGLPEIFSLSQQAEMFQRKGLMDGMWRKMEKAMVLCERYEEFHLWRDLLKKKRTILMADAKAGFLPEELQNFDSLYSEVKLKGKNIDEYRELEDLIEIAQGKGTFEMFETATLLLANPLLDDDAPRLSVRAEIKYCIVKRAAFRWSNQQSLALKYAERIVAILDETPFLLLDNDYKIIAIHSLYFIGMYSAAFRKFDSANDCVERLKALKNLPVPIFERLHSLELQIALEQGEYDNGVTVIERISEGLEVNEYRVRGDRKISYYFQIAQFYLFFSEPEKALPWVLKMRSLENIDHKRDLQDFGEILYLVCHFDLGNFKFLIRSEIEKALGYLRKRNALTVYEEAIIKGLRKCAKANTVQNRNSRLVRLLGKLEALLDAPELKYKGNYFQFQIWIASHLEGKMPIEILKSSEPNLD